METYSDSQHMQVERRRASETLERSEALIDGERK